MFNKKHIVIFLAILTFFMSVAVAANVNETTDFTTSDATIATQDTTNVQNIQTIANEDNNKITKENKNIKEDTASTINIDDDNFDYEKQQKTENKENIIKTTNNENKSLKTTGEPTVINITEENFSEWFSINMDNRAVFKIDTNGPKIINLYYIPSNIAGLDLQNWYDTFDDSEYSFIGKNNLTIRNTPLLLLGAKVTLSNITFICDDAESLSDNYFLLIRRDGYLPDYYVTLDNIKVNYTGGYSKDLSSLITFKLGTGDDNYPINITCQNSEIYAKIPPTSSGTTIINLQNGAKFMNNTVTIIEEHATADDSSIVAINVTSGSAEIKDNNITMNGESTLTAIKVNTNTNTITNNNITVTTTGTATGVELNGNDNTVKDNKISANDKTGNDAVTVTGENNIVENNTAAEVNTRIPTNIELNYDATPIDVGQQLTIRGVFTTEGQDAAAEGIKIYDNEEELTSINTDEDGTIIYTYTPTVAGDHNITFKFEGNQTHKETETTISITVNMKTYTIKVDTTEFTPSTTATISASIYSNDEKATDINNGKITFKVNGKTLKDATTGKVIYAKVINGTATIENYQIPENWKNGTTIQATYTGSSDVAKMSSDKTEITITTTQPTFTTEDITTTQGGTITLKATITDGNKVINTGKVVFKINGKTVKDANGKVIYAKVTNNQANITYTLPDTYKAKNYTITATFISSDYERLEDTKTLTIN